MIGVARSFPLRRNNLKRGESQRARETATRASQSRKSTEMRWFILWLAGAASIALGLSIAYLGPSSLPTGKGSASGSLMISLPLPLILVGLVALVCSVAGIWWSQSKLAAKAITSESPRPVGAMTSEGRWSADIAARVGLAVAIAALAGEIVFFVGISIEPGSYFGAPGLPGIIPLVGFAAWPLALCATAINWLAVTRGTGRHAALLGVTLGSFTLVLLPAWFLLAAFGLFGGE